VSTSSCVKPSSASIQAGTLDRNASSLQRSQNSGLGAFGTLASHEISKDIADLAALEYSDINTMSYLLSSSVDPRVCKLQTIFENFPPKRLHLT
jgi:hypothetical protein